MRQNVILFLFTLKLQAKYYQFFKLIFTYLFSLHSQTVHIFATFLLKLN